MTKANFIKVLLCLIIIICILFGAYLYGNLNDALQNQQKYDKLTPMEKGIVDRMRAKEQAKYDKQTPEQKEATDRIRKEIEEEKANNKNIK